MSFSFSNRSEYLKQLENSEFDLVIIGGGINGAGIARDASMRGMKVALIESNDFAFGTSSRSSKLVHGGIRYLENYEFGLVFEALNERQKLFSMAPHLVHPLRFLIPLYKSGRVGMFLMGIGMWLYDALSLFQAPELHERLSASESLDRLPSLQGKDLLGSYVYSDAYMDDDRLVLETLRSAVAHGCVALSYVRAVGADFNNEKEITSVVVEDLLGKKKIKIKGKHFVSTVGVWTDELALKLLPKWEKVLRPTKGVHLTFEKSRVPLSSAVVMAAESRIVFGIPRHEMVIIGTTDTDFKGNPEDVVATKEDVQYLLEVVRNYFPGIDVNASDIIASYAGVRPLVSDGSSTEGKTSREHSIWTDESGLTFVAGGKYTTYRNISEHAVNHCLRYFKIEDRVRFSACRTELPLNPMITEESFSNALEVETWLVKNSSLSNGEAKLLHDRHGAEASVIVSKFGANKTYWQYEAHHSIEETMCFNLVDFYTRRTPLVLAYKDHGLKFLDEIVQVFESKLKWSASEKAEQIQKLKAHIEKEFAWKNQLYSAPS